MKLAEAIKTIMTGGSSTVLDVLIPPYRMLPIDSKNDIQQIVGRNRRVYTYSVENPFQLWAKRPWETDTMGYDCQKDFAWMLRDAIGIETENLDKFEKIILDSGTGFMAVVKNNAGEPGKGIWLTLENKERKME